MSRLQFADFISSDIFRKLRSLTPSIGMYFSIFSNGEQKSVYLEERVLYNMKKSFSKEKYVIEKKSFIGDHEIYYYLTRVVERISCMKNMFVCIEEDLK